EDVAAGTEGSVKLKVKVLKSALTPHKVINEGTTIQVGNDKEVTLKPVENPVPEPPHKKETAPYEGTGTLGGVKVGDEITYEISYINYEKEAADVKIMDTLDPNVEFVDADNGGVYDADKHVVNWTVANVDAGKEDKVTLTVKVLEGALQSKGGEGKVVNGGDTTTVQVGNGPVYNVEVVENPVPEPPVKEEVTPYEGTGELGAVKVGDEITYEISYINYKQDKADVTIKDTLDPNVEFVSASDEGTEDNGVVNWTIKDVEAGKEGKVTLTVKVLEGALESKGGEGEVVNGGPGTTVKVGNDKEYEVNTVTNPVPEEPHKKEIAPYEGIGELGGVKVGDEITYEISYKNYKKDTANVTIKDTLDPNVEFVSASDGGAKTGNAVFWTIENVEAGKEGTVTLTVKVLEGALQSKKGPGKVVNGGDSTTVKVGNDQEYSVEVVENPVPEPPVPEEPHKREISPYKGNGTLGEVNVGDEITYEISYKNYKDEAVDVVIKDTLDKNVEYVSTSDGGKLVNGVVIWTLKDVEAGKAGKVTLTVKVLKGALKSNGGPGKVVNGGPSATVKIGNDDEVSLEVVENPVKEKQVPPPPHKSRTGDNNPIGLLLLLMALAGGGLAAVIVYRRKQIKE
ncbi:MAG: DUF11 domain-containing protein, partial [Lachnospiraceae bacterium]|nr:DUF11 domain-containing protein [Lachnospiraceae bacterium]